jgi:hypothetical protein
VQGVDAALFCIGHGVNEIESRHNVGRQRQISGKCLNACITPQQLICCHERIGHISKCGSGTNGRIEQLKNVSARWRGTGSWLGEDSDNSAHSERLRQ